MPPFGNQAPKPKKKDGERELYFNNPVVEELLTEYVIHGCTDVHLRDEIMSHASELIRQVIRTHNLHNIYPGKDNASFGDLFQTAWVQIEKTLYKFDHSPGHTKVFNMWSQIARTCMLAHIKREGRDKKNQGTYKSWLDNKQRSKPAVMDRFFTEVKEICKYNDEHIELIEHLEDLYEHDERAYDGLIGKLIKKSGRSRQRVHNFLEFIKLRSIEFTDSPANDIPKRRTLSNPGIKDYDNDDED